MEASGLASTRWRGIAAGLIVAGLAAGCSSSSTSSSTTRATSVERSTTSTSSSTAGGETTTSAPMTTSESGLVKVTSPKPGAQVSSPIQVAGSANVFEAALNADLIAPNGRVMATRNFMATAGSGTWGTFSTAFGYPVGYTGPATLNVYSISPKDGSQVNLVSIPVVIS